MHLQNSHEANKELEAKKLALERENEALQKKVGLTDTSIFEAPMHLYHTLPAIVTVTATSQPQPHQTAGTDRGDEGSYRSGRGGVCLGYW